MPPELTAPATPGTPAAPATPVTPTTANTANAPSAVDAPQPAASSSVVEAGAVFKNASSWADVTLPNGQKVAPPGEAPAEADAAAESEAATPTGDAPEFVQDETGRWHRADGTMASTDEIAQIEAELAAQSSAETPATETPTEPAKDPKDAKESIVTLRRRDGTTRDVVIEDPELAQEIRQNVNDGMRRKEFVEKSAALDARLAQFNKIDALLTNSPETFIAQSLSEEQRIRVGVMLLAQDFDKLVPIIQQYDQNPSERIAAVADAQTRIRQQEQDIQALTIAQRSAADVKAAVAALVPEETPDDIAEQFWADASMDCQRAMARGEEVSPKTVAAILAQRMKLYGFASTGSAPAAAPPRIALAAPQATPTQSPPPSPVAQPANDAAKTLADAQKAQRRIRLTQTSRTHAAAVPPQGAGAAPVRMPPVAPGASIEDASRALKKQRSWTS